MLVINQEQTAKTKPEPKLFLKAGQSVQGEKNPVNVPSILSDAQVWEIAMNLNGYSFVL